MPIYIDKDKLIRDLIDNRNFYPAIVKRAIEKAPTEDVVPRTEVVRLQAQVNRLKAYDEERDIQLHQRLVTKAKQEVARKIFEELEKNPVIMQSCIFIDKKQYAELKKKYIGE